MSVTYRIMFADFRGIRPELKSEVFQSISETEAKRQAITFMRGRKIEGGLLQIRIEPDGEIPECWKDVGRVNAGPQRLYKKQKPPTNISPPP